MTVTFVYRGVEAGPACKHVHRVEARRILDAFRAGWPTATDGEDYDAAPERQRRGLEQFGPGFAVVDELYYVAAEEGWPPPRNRRELHQRWRWLQENDPEGVGGVNWGPNHLEVLASDEENFNQHVL